MLIRLMILSCTFFFGAQHLHGEPSLSFEIKPIPSFKPTYTNGQELSVGAEMHLTGKISLFASYLKSRRDHDHKLNSGDELRHEGLQAFLIDEWSAGIALYSNPSPTSLYVGAGLIQRKADYTAHVNAIPVEWRREAADPFMTLGYRWNYAGSFFIRTGMLARWNKSQTAFVAGEAQGFYLRDESYSLIETQIEEIEKTSELKVALDFGLGVIF